MNKANHHAAPTGIWRPERNENLVTLDDHLLAHLDKLAAVGLLESWETRAPVQRHYTSKKSMRELAKGIPMATNCESSKTK